MVAIASLQAASRAALASRQSAVTCRAQRTSSRVQQFATAAAISTSLLVAAPAFANSVNFSTPQNGTKLISSVILEMTVAGTTTQSTAHDPCRDHFHVSVDDAEQPMKGTSIEAFKHYRKGQTLTDISLAPLPLASTTSASSSSAAAASPEPSTAATPAADADKSSPNHKPRVIIIYPELFLAIGAWTLFTSSDEDDPLIPWWMWFVLWYYLVYVL